jgi:hypothetical protein
MVDSEPGPIPPHRHNTEPDWRETVYDFRSVHRSRLIFEGDQLVGILCPGCDNEVLTFFAESSSASCQMVEAEHRAEERRTENKRVAQHWTEHLSQRWSFIVRKPRDGSSSHRRVHLPNCPALKTVLDGSNYFGSNEKPEGYPECRICFGWTGYQGPTG